MGWSDYTPAREFGALDLGLLADVADAAAAALAEAVELTLFGVHLELVGRVVYGWMVV